MILRRVLEIPALVPEGEGLLGTELRGGDPVCRAEVGGGGEGGAQLVGGQRVGGLGDEAIDVIDGGRSSRQRCSCVVGAAGGEC